MSNLPAVKKVIWAVDALTEDFGLHQKAISMLRAWAKECPISIEPVYVLSPDQLRVPVEAFTAVANEGMTEAKARLTRLMKETHLPGLLEPTLLTSPNFSLRMAVQSLLDYARLTKASHILASTQSKKGASRFLFGSFAESLVLQSEIPVFLVSPKTNPAGLKHVLFSTDLSEKSREAFEEIVREAKDRHFRVTVYNKVEYLNNYSMDPITVIPSYHKILEQDLLKRKAQTNELVQWAKTQGVEATAFVDDQPNEANVATAILEAASKTKADTIALASQSGRIASAILGSVTRQVVRGAELPVWVVHPRGTKEQTRGKVAV